MIDQEVFAGHAPDKDNAAHVVCAAEAHLVVLLYFHPIRVFGKIWS